MFLFFPIFNLILNSSSMVNTDLYKPSKLREICAKNGLRPSKSYGQNFLVSPHPIEKILAVGELDKNDIIIPFIHGAISQLTKGIINPSTK